MLALVVLESLRKAKTGPARLDVRRVISAAPDPVEPEDRQHLEAGQVQRAQTPDITAELAARLVERNRVTIYDNFARDALTATGLASHPNVTVVRGDILDLASLTEAMRGHSHVVHCAAIAGIDTVIRSPVTTMRVNMIGSANVLDAASKLDNCQRVVCFSTSEVFGQHAFRSSETDQTVMGRVGEAR